MDQNEFTEVYSLTTGLKQRIPAIWLEDPVLGRDFRKTPSQREIDGELGPRPRQDSTVKEIDKYADQVGIDLPSGADKDAKLAAVEDVFVHADVQAGLIEVEPAPPVVDPLNPVGTAVIDPVAAQPVAAPEPVPSEPDTTNPPAAGDEEN